MLYIVSSETRGACIGQSSVKVEIYRRHNFIVTCYQGYSQFERLCFECILALLPTIPNVSTPMLLASHLNRHLRDLHLLQPQCNDLISLSAMQNQIYNQARLSLHLVLRVRTTTHPVGPAISTVYFKS